MLYRFILKVGHTVTPSPCNRKKPLRLRCGCCLLILPENPEFLGSPGSQGFFPSAVVTVSKRSRDRIQAQS